MRIAECGLQNWRLLFHKLSCLGTLLSRDLREGFGFGTRVSRSNEWVQPAPILPSHFRGAEGEVVWFSLLLFIILSCLLSVAPAFAETEEHAPVILVIADYLSLEDFEEADHPNIKYLLSHGAVGLISPSALGLKTPLSVYTSIGSGVHMRGTNAADEAYNVDEIVTAEQSSAAEVYFRRTGITLPEEGVVNLGFASLLRANDKNSRYEMIGLMGRSFRRAGKKIAVFGNSDIGDRVRRPAAAVAMDERGRIPLGNVSSEMLRREPASATGWVTDISRLSQAVKQSVQKADVIIVDFGDTARLYNSKHELTLRAYESYKNDTMNRLGLFVGEMGALADETGARLILASFVPQTDLRGSWSSLTPIIIYGRDFKRGILSSHTTRRPGLIAGVDIAPTLLEISGIPVPHTMIGRCVELKNSTETLTHLSRLDNMVRVNSVLRWPLLAVEAILGGLIITLAAAVIAFRIKLNNKLNALLRGGLILSYAFLPGLLFGGLGGGSSVQVTVRNVVLGTLGALAAGYILALLFRPLVRREILARAALPMVGMFIITSVIVLVDGITGSKLVGSSIASYHFTAGFRYYGIGNEYMGVLIGSLFASILWMSIVSGNKEPKKGWLTVVILVFTITVFVLGWPGYGANAGGAVAAVVTFGLAYRAVSKGVFRAREAAILTAASLVLLVSFAFIDLALNRSASSHLGLTVGVWSRENLANALQMVSRKVLMNLSLIDTRQSRTTIMGFIPFFALWYYYIKPRVGELCKRYPRLGAGIAAGLVGAGAAFIFNDSGVISASIIVASLVCCLLYSLLQEEAAGAADNGS